MLKVCPNINHPDAQAIIAKVGIVQFYKIYRENGEVIPSPEGIKPSLSNIDYSLKVIDVLQGEKIQTLYDRFYVKNPAKFYSELQVLGTPKEQTQMLKDWNANNPTESLDEMIAGIGAQLLYPVEINITEQRRIENPDDYESGMELQLAREFTDEFDPTEPSTHYSSLAVPGGTNYRENEIRTPFITPAIKGHATFATAQGIGWFRSDDKAETTKEVLSSEEDLLFPEDAGREVDKITATKTRRILEMQSDLFQKGRDREKLTNPDNKADIDKWERDQDNKPHFSVSTTIQNGTKIWYVVERAMENEEFLEETYNTLEEAQQRAKKENDRVEEIDKANPSPNPIHTTNHSGFLQLLNKGGNWINFFIKSIVNDSIKRGYEEVWFPSGNTASKVEGHSTLEEFKKQKQDRIEELKKEKSGVSNKYGLFDLDPGMSYGIFNTRKAAEKKAKDLQLYNNYKITNLDRWGSELNLDKIDREIDQLTKELEDVEREGFGKLKPIHTFYETRVKNILEKTYPSVQVTDEYGNTWNKVDLRNIKPSATKILFNKLDTKQSFEERATNLLLSEGIAEKAQVLGNGSLILNRENLSDSLTALTQINESYYTLHGVRPFYLNKVTDRIMQVGVDTDIVQFNNIPDSRAIARAKKLLDRLSEATGIQHELISTEQAQELTSQAGITWGGEPAFFHAGKVYVIQDRLNNQNVLHEFSHPFVATLARLNPKLYNYLYDEFKNTGDPAIDQIFATVRKLYSFAEDSREFMDEVFVRILTANSLKKLEQNRGIAGLFRKLWYALKQTLRSIFGEKASLENLSEDTTLDELSQMLLLGDEKLDKEVSDFPLFNREMAREMEQLDQAKIIQNINLVGTTLTSHLNKMGGTHYKELRGELRNESDASIILDANKLIKAAQELEGNIVEQTKMLTSFAQAIMGVNLLSKKMRDFVETFNQKGMDEQDQLRVLTYYGYMIKDWEPVLKELASTNTKDFPLLRREVNDARDNFEKITNYTDVVYKKGLVQVLRKEFDPLNKFVDEYYPREIAKYQAAYDKGDRTVVNKIAELKDEYRKFNLNDDTILAYISGQMGDANPFSGVFESFSSNSDPVVGGFAVLIEKTMRKVEIGLQKFSTQFRRELNPFYEEGKKLGQIDMSNPEKLCKQLTFLDDVFSRDKDKNPKRVKVHMFLNEFSGGWLYEYKEWEDKLKKATDANDKPLIAQITDDFDDFKEKYFHREYKDEIYEAKKFWKRSDLHKEADRRRKEITAELRNLQSFTIKDQETLDSIASYLKQLKVLASTKNLDGTDKVDTDDNPMLSIAKIIQEYQELTRSLYDEYEIKGAFSRSMKAQEDLFLDQGLVKDTPEYNKALSNWIKQNTRIILTSQFYDGRQAILDKISGILAEAAKNQKLDAETQAKVEKLRKFTSETWSDILQQVKGFRDKDGQPIGTELSKEKIAEIKKLQEKTIEAQDTIRAINDLTPEEEQFVNDFIQNVNASIWPSAEDGARYKELLERQRGNGLTKLQKSELLNAFEELRMFQSKIPTEYYLDTFNERIKEVDPNFTLTMDNVDDTLLADNIGRILQTDSEFSKWFKANHILRERWNTDIQGMEEYYERVFAWNRIVPNDSQFKNALKNNDYRAMLTLKSPYVQVKWASKYYFYKVKDEYKTERKVGENVDNRGNWLPKTRAEGAYVDQNGVSTFENKRYFELKNSTKPEDKNLFEILKIYKKNFLKAQEETHDYTKLWYEVPRLRKHRLENIDNIFGDTKNALKNGMDWIKNAVSFNSQIDALDKGQVSEADLQQEHKMYVMTDLLGNEIQTIPMKFMTPMDADLVSMDLGRSILKYAGAVETNKAMHDLNPISQALRKILKQEGVTDISKTGLINYLGKLISGSPKVKDKNTRLQTIINMTDRFIHGIESKMELGVFGNKVATHLMGIAARTSLALNIPAAVKNLFAARIQNVLESISRDHFTFQDWKDASHLFMDKYVGAFMRDYNKFSGFSLQTQLFELFDAIQGGFMNELGEQFSASLKKDVVELKILSSGQKFGELNAQGSAFLAMMKNTKVPIEKNGVITKKSYLDVWVMKPDGTIGVEDGVDPTWGPGGEEFLKFSVKVHKVNELLQGAYSKMNQAEMSRYTSGRLVGFMRRYFVPALVKRAAPRRANIALGTITEGHYQTFVKYGLDFIKSKKNHWHLLTENEKRNVWRTLGEMTYSLGFFLLISMLGYNGEDKDKNKKLKEMSWAHQMLLYELMMVKGESETFIPLPYMGMNELLRLKDQPSIAFPILNKYYKLFVHAGEWMADPMFEGDLSHYTKKTGIWDKGDLKMKADLFKIIGYTGATADPRQGIINFNAAMNRYN